VTRPGCLSRERPDRLSDVGDERAPLHAGRATRLRDLGYDEIWLQNWLSAEPDRMGLGPVDILAQELTNPRGGSLDILAADGDTYYSVEVQLGEVDASHGFRVFDYWARNRERYPNKIHVAVLMAESASGRFRAALEALAEYLPLLVIELRSWRGGAEAVVVSEIVVANESLDIGGQTGGTERTEADWREECSDEAWQFYEDFVAWARTNVGEIRVDFSPKSYIGIRRGRRVWAPLWFRKDGANVHLPDPDRSRSEEPSVAFDDFRERLRAVGLEPSWQTTYNAGSNPVSLRLKRADLGQPVVHELLRSSYESLDPTSVPWSQQHPPRQTVGPPPVQSPGGHVDEHDLPV
jgi:hypothetical protein